MAIVSKVSYIDSHRVAINTGFQINYALPYSWSNIITPTYFGSIRSFGNKSSPVVAFLNKLVESDNAFSSEKSDTKIPAYLPMVNDYAKPNIRNKVENSTTKNLVSIDDNERTTTETETATKTKKKLRMKKDVTAAEFYNGIKDTLLM